MIGVQKVGILGGMGPSAGLEFVRLFLNACTTELGIADVPMSDQVFPEHYLIQAPIPDRTTALELGGGFRNAPLNAMADAMNQFSAAGVSTVAIACNTAHAWHAQLQEQFPELNILHVAREVARLLQHLQIPSVGLLATNGTYAAGIYEVALEEVGVTCHTPTIDERQVLMKGIYEGVKRGNILLAQSHFRAVAQAVLQRTGVPALILGCTEIPLALKDGTFGSSVKLIDPANLLAQTLARHAYGLVQAPTAVEDRCMEQGSSQLTSSPHILCPVHWDK